MEQASKFLLVDQEVLPEVFLKVIEAKDYLQSGKAASSSEAARMAGLSRSAFYKYKHSVYKYTESTSSIITLYTVLSDRPGVLSSLISAISSAGANILTINQNIPVSGVAAVSVSARTEGLQMTLDELLQNLRQLNGVERIENIAENK